MELKYNNSHVYKRKSPLNHQLEVKKNNSDLMLVNINNLINLNNRLMKLNTTI